MKWNYVYDMNLQQHPAPLSHKNAATWKKGKKNNKLLDWAQFIN